LPSISINLIDFPIEEKTFESKTFENKMTSNPLTETNSKILKY